MKRSPREGGRLCERGGARCWTPRRRRRRCGHNCLAAQEMRRRSWPGAIVRRRRCSNGFGRAKRPGTTRLMPGWRCIWQRVRGSSPRRPRNASSSGLTAAGRRGGAWMRVLDAWPRSHRFQSCEERFRPVGHAASEGRAGRFLPVGQERVLEIRNQDDTIRYLVYPDIRNAGARRPRGVERWTGRRPAAHTAPEIRRDGRSRSA